MDGHDGTGTTGAAPVPRGIDGVVVVPDVRLGSPSVPLASSGWGLSALAELLCAELDAIDAAVGLAAVQVGVPVRAFVMWAGRYGSCDGTDHGRVVVVDPVVTSWGPLEGEAEGCLSVPGRRVWVERPRFVRLTGRDGTGRSRTWEFEGWEARVALHELDHLDGVLIVDRGTPLAG